MRCPNCSGEMTAVEVDRLYVKTLSLDVCRACQLVWFDHAELLQLAPAGTLRLVSLFTDDRDDGAARPPLAPGLACPRCQRRLRDVHDMQRGTRFTYGQCDAGHGRLFTFYQFLRAKNFVRALGAAEIDELRRHVRQVNCVNCGAAIDVGHDAACQFCRTPIAILDPDQVRRAVDELRQALDRKPVDTTLPLSMALEKMRAERVFAEVSASARQPSVLDLFFGSSSDPLVAGLKALRRLLEP